MKETYEICYSEDAFNDLREIYSYITDELLVPETAANMLGRIRSEIRLLVFMPTRHPIVDWEPWKSMEMHKLPIGNFIAYYLVDNEKMSVTVTRVIYGGRDIGEIVNKD